MRIRNQQVIIIQSVQGRSPYISPYGYSFTGIIYEFDIKRTTLSNPELQEPVSWHRVHEKA